MRLALAALVVAFPAAAADRIADCTIAVKGRVYLRGPCSYSPQKDGSFSIGTGDKKRSKYFAYVNKNEDGTAEAFWNEDPRSNHAQTPLGTVSRNGACWSNATAKICAR